MCNIQRGGVTLEGRTNINTREGRANSSMRGEGEL